MFAVFIFSSILFFGAVASDASFIRFNAETTTIVSNNSVKMSIALTNEGDEAAYNVQIDALFDKIRKSTRVVREMAPGDDMKFTVSNQLADDFGHIVIPLMIHYEDANSHPFSALTYSDARTDVSMSPQILVTAGKTTLSEKSDIRVSVKNLTDSDINIRVRLIVPKEITVLEKNTEIMLSGSEEKETKFDLRNYAALPGSKYTVLAVVSAYSGGIRFDQKALGMVEIRESGWIGKALEYRNWMLVVFAFLIFFYFIIQFRNRKCAG